MARATSLNELKMSEHAETPNPTPANFVASGPYSSDINDPNDPLYTLAPTPANLLNAVVNSVNGAVSSPTASPTSTPEVVAAMQQIFPSWDLNEGETYTVLVVFFLVAIGVLIGMFFLIQYCMNRGHQKELLAEDTPSGSQVGEERPLLQPSKTASNIPALKTLLQAPGKTCQMYTSKGPKTVKMSLKGNTLVWESSSSFMASKTYSIDLASVLFVTANKKSKNLRSKAVVPDELCFSLVTHDASLDISVDRKNERDVLVLGFGEIVSQLKSTPNP